MTELRRAGRRKHNKAKKKTNKGKLSRRKKGPYQPHKFEQTRNQKQNEMKKVRKNRPSEMEKLTPDITIITNLTNT